MKKTARHYRDNPESRAKKNAYQKEYNKKTVDDRVELNRINRQNHAAGKSKPHDGKDVSHTKKGGTVLEKQSTNRARQGAGGKAKKK